MGTIVSVNALVAVSALAPEFTALGLVLGMALGRYRKHDWWGFVPVYAGILAWHVIIRLGVGLQNPLPLYTNTPGNPDYTDANRVLNIIYPVLLFFFTWIGFVFHKILSNIQLLQITEKIPYPLRSQSMPSMMLTPSGEFTVRTIVHDRNAPDRNYGIVGLTSSGWQQVLSLLWILGALCTPQVIYDYYIMKTGHELMCFLVVLFVPAGGTLIFTGIFYRWTDPGTFGLTKEWLVKNNDQYKLKQDEIESIDKATKMRVLWTMLPIAFFAFIGYGLIAGWKYWRQDVDEVWLGAIGVWTLFALLLFGVCIMMRQPENPFVSTKTIRRIDDSEGMVEQMASSAEQLQELQQQQLASLLPKHQNLSAQNMIYKRGANNASFSTVFTHDERLFS